MKDGPAFQTYPIETIRDLLFQAVDRYGHRDALSVKREGVYTAIRYSDLRRQAECLGTALLAMGLSKGDRLAIISENRPEWAITYLAAVCTGLTAVPVDRDLKDHEIRHILEFSDAKVLVGARDYLRSLTDVLPPCVEMIVSMDEDYSDSDWTFANLVSQGADKVAEGNRSFSDAAVSPDDLAALIFTSGTTGASKAVMLSHRNISANVMGTSYHVAIDQNDVVLSVLPLHHTYESTAGFLISLYQGALICYAENLRRIAENLKETRATILLGVPALFEAMYRRIYSAIQDKGKRKFHFAKGLATVSEKILRLKLRRWLFRALHDRFGGRLRLMISGGAAINPKVSKGFRELGIDFIQGYGMTENSPIVAVNRVDRFKDDSVGLPLPETEVEIIDDEIVVRGPSVMLGYFKNEAATRETIRDGWLYTGDLGYFDRDGFLHISGRRKSVIVTPNGKNVYPEEIEAILNQMEFVRESLVWGGPEQDPAETEVQAVVVPDTDVLDRNFGPDGYDDEKIMEVISADVRSCNRRLASFKRIKKFVIRNEEFEKTTTRKIKRYLYTSKTKPLRKRA